MVLYRPISVNTLLDPLVQDLGNANHSILQASQGRLVEARAELGLDSLSLTGCKSLGQRGPFRRVLCHR